VSLTNGFGLPATVWNLQGSLTPGFIPGIDPVGNEVVMTDGETFEATSAWLNFPVVIDNFIATFVYTVPPNSPPPGGLTPGEGVVFVVQNSPQGATIAPGSSGSPLGINNVKPSLDFEINIAPTSPTAVGIAMNVNGGIGSYSSTNVFPAGLNYWSSGDPVQFTITYSTNGNNVGVTLLDLNTLVTFSTNYSVNVRALMESDTAFIGFTAATGADASQQNIGNVTFIGYSAAPVLSAQAAAGAVTLTWAIAPVTGNTVLYSSPTLGAPASWTEVTPQPAISVVNGHYQMSVPANGRAQFYRLKIQ
jgi:hypothetical protein